MLFYTSLDTCPEPHTHTVEMEKGQRNERIGKYSYQGGSLDEYRVVWVILRSCILLITQQGRPMHQEIACKGPKQSLYVTYIAPITVVPEHSLKYSFAHRSVIRSAVMRHTQTKAQNLKGL